MANVWCLLTFSDLVKEGSTVNIILQLSLDVTARKYCKLYFNMLEIVCCEVSEQGHGIHITF